MKTFLLILLLSQSSLFAQSDSWIVRYNQLGGSDGLSQIGPDSTTYENATGMAVDQGGNVIITGFSSYLTRPQSTPYQALTLKYNSSGEKLWEAFYRCPEWEFGCYANPRSVETDAAGNVYVAGVFWSNEDADIMLIKYDSDGEEQWVQTYAGQSGEWDDVVDLAVDVSGNVVLSGRVTDTNTGVDFLLLKYAPDGTRIWTRQYDANSGRDDRVVAMTLDRPGNIYLTGRTEKPEEGANYLTAKFNSDGLTEWAAQFNGTANASDSPSAIAVDTMGNVYVTGTVTMLPSNGFVYDSSGQRIAVKTDGSDFGTVKYNCDGEEVWSRFFDGDRSDMHTNDEARGILIDARGYLVVHGVEGRLDGYTQPTFVKYTEDGDLLYAKKPETYYGTVRGAVADQDGNIYATGVPTATPPARGIDLQIATLMFDRNGEIVWEARYNANPVHGRAGLDGESPVALCLDNQGNVYVTGENYFPRTGTDYVLIKYGASPPSMTLVASAGASLNAISFLDDLNGWVAGKKGTLMKTRDAGATWQRTPIPTRGELRGVQFIDENVGYVIGAKGIILRTEDGGGSWVSLTDRLHRRQRTDFSKIRFADRDNGIIVGKNGLVLRTIDAGENWNEVASLKQAEDVFFLNLTRGWAVGQKGLVTRTDDGGATWTRLTPTSREFSRFSLDRVSFSDENNGWAGGKNILLSTSDGGNSWVAFPIRTAGRLHKIRAEEGKRGTALIRGTSPVLLSSLTVKKSFGRAGESVNDAAHLGSVLFAVSERGSILRSSGETSGAAGRGVVPTFLPGTTYKLAQNYPNPFNPMTIISYELSTESRVRIIVSDMLGRELRVLVDEIQPSGPGMEVWDGTDDNGLAVASGVYFYRLEAYSIADEHERFSQVRKMTIIR